MKTKIKAILFLALLLGRNKLAMAEALPENKFDQYQASKRQEEVQKRHIEAPSSKLEQTPFVRKEVLIPKEPYRFLIKDFIVKGKDAGKFKWLETELKVYKGRLIGAKGIEVLAEMLSEKILARGFVTTKISVPEQDLKTGVVTFMVSPGYIEDIRFVNKEMYGSWRNAFPNRPGGILNARDIEQGLEQMKQVSNQDVNVSIVSGKEKGQSIILLDVKRTKPWHLAFSFDDAGLENTGRLQFLTNAALYNPTGLNDILSFSYTKDAENEDRLKGTKNYGLYYSVPFGLYTVSINKYYNEFYQKVPALIPFESRGKTTTYDFGVQRVFYRDSLRKTQGSIKVIKRHKAHYVNGEEVKLQRLNTTAYQLGVLHRQYIGKGIFDGMVYFQKGMPWLKAELGAVDKIEGMGTTRYNLWGLNLYYGIPFKLGSIATNYSFIFRGQYTSDVLYGADHFSIGGRYSVRGFSGENTLAAENGYIMRHEFSFPLKKLEFSPYLGLDYGRVFGKSDENNLGSSLAGIVLGIKGRITKQLRCDCFIGKPLYYPKGFKADKTVLGFNFMCQV